MPQEQKGSGEAIRITTAARSHLDDIRARQKRYLFSMSLRTICFVGAVIVRDGIFMWLLIAGALILPYIAVVMANVAAPRIEDPELRETAYTPLQLGGGDPALRLSSDQ